MNRNPITKKGFNQLEKELENLIKIERTNIQKVIQEARAHGDLKENAEYKAAKEKQALMEGKISQIQHTLNNSQIIDITTIKSEKIVFGATVTLIDVEKEKTCIYQIVGERESDKKNGRISYTSPLGKVLIGKEIGDTVIVRAPKGDIEYEIQAAKYE